MGLSLVFELDLDGKCGNRHGRMGLVRGFAVVVLGEELWVSIDKF